MRIAIYYNTTKGLESYKQNPKAPVVDSLRLLQEFKSGVEVVGDTVIECTQVEYTDADLAVIFGYGRERVEGAPQVGSFQAKRCAILNQCEQAGIPVVSLDSGLFISYKHKKYWRVGLGSPLNDGDFFDADYDEQRAIQFTKDTGIYPKPYHKHGEYIILCLQPSLNWSMKGRDPISWANDKIQEIRQYTDMPIHVRNHPGDPDALDKVEMIGDTRPYKAGKTPLWQHCQRAHALVTFNSTAATDALAEGTPVFVDHPECHAWPVANTDISNITEPYYYDRTDWFNRMCYRIWRYDEMANGTLYTRIKNYLERKNNG